MVQCFWTLRRAEVATLRWGTLTSSAASSNVWGRAASEPGRSSPRRRRGAAGVPVEAAPVDDRAYVFPGRWDSEPMRAQSVGAAVRGCCAGPAFTRPWRGAHALRRTFATNFLRSNPADLRGLQALMRH